MNRKHLLTIVLAAILAGLIVYILYVLFGPYKRRSVENEQLREEVETRLILESKMEKEIGELTGTLEKIKAQLAQKTQLGDTLQAKVEGLEQTITNMENQRDAVLAETERLRELLGESEQSLRERNLQIESYQEKVKGLEQQLARQETEVVNLEDEGDRLRQTITSLETGREILNQEMSELREELQDSRNRLAALSLETASREKESVEAGLTQQALIEGLREEVQLRNSQIDSLEDEMEDLRGEYHQKTRTLEGQLVERDRELKQLRKEAGQLVQTIASLETDKEALSQKTGQLTTDLEESRNRIGVLSLEMASQEDKFEQEELIRQRLIVRLQRDIEEKAVQVSRLQDQIKDLRGEFRQKVGGLEAQLERWQRQYENLQTEADQLQQTVTALEQEKADLLGEFEESQGRLQESSREVAARDRRLEEFNLTHQTQVKELRSEIEKKAMHIGSLEEEIDTIKSEFDQRVEGLEEQITQRDRQLKDFRDKAEQLRETITSLEADRNALAEEASGLKRELEEARDRLATLSLEIDFKDKEFEQVDKTRQALIVQLEDQVQKKDVRISLLQEKLTIQFLDKILFNPGNATITPQGREILMNVAVELKKLTETEIRVEGHTDSQSLSEASRAVYIDNLGLSAARAAAVARTFRRMGVDPNHLSAAGYSMYRPVASNATPEERQQNRRVEILLIPLH